MDRNDRTYTYNITENTTEGITSVSKSLSENNNIKIKSDADVDFDAITEMVNELIVYDLLYTDFENPEIEYDVHKDEFNGILEDVRNVLVYEVFSAPNDKRCNFGNREDPDYKSNAVVKNIFYKHLGFSTVKSYINQYLNSSTKVKNVPMYHIKSLYRQCLTQSSQYLSGGRSLYVRDSLLNK